MEALSRPEPGYIALDVATGTGNTALALASHLRLVIGVDLTRQMLAEAQRPALEGGIENARCELRPERRKGQLSRAYWHPLIRAVKR